MRTLICLIALLIGGNCQAQTQREDGSWHDNNLSLRIERDLIKSKGEIYFCVADTSRDACIENLRTGLLVKVYDAQNQLLWEGKASGRRKGLKFPRPYPQAAYLEIEAFKPWVVNVSSGTRIHQDEALYLKHQIAP